MARRGPSRICRPPGRPGRQRPDRDHRRGVLRADPGDDPQPGPRGPDPQLHPLAAKPPGHDGSRHVGSRTGLGTGIHPRPGQRRHRVHDSRRLPFQDGRPDRFATPGLPDHRRRRLRAERLPRQRETAVHDSLCLARGNDRPPGLALRAAAGSGLLVRRRRREVRHLAGNEEARLRGRLALPVFRRPGGQPELAADHHAFGSDRQRAAGGQGLPARLQLSRDDRMGLAYGAVGRVPADHARDARRRPADGLAAVCGRRLLAELQAEVSRGRRDVLPHDDGQPAVARGDRRRRRRASSSRRPARNFIGRSATAATGTGPSAASTCRTSGTRSIVR